MRKFKLTQYAWEIWFIGAVIGFGCIFFVCTLEGSANIVELPYMLGVAFINLAYCIYCGCQPSEYK